jgi:hypothetical protein
MQTLIDTKKHRFGIQFSKLQQRDQRGVHPDDFPALFKLIAAVDKSAVILPHNNDIKKAKGVASIMKGKDFEAMLDLTTERWGSPSDNQSRLAFSFYIASSIISPDMKTLRFNDKFSQFLEVGDYRMAPHSLHETNSKPIGFFLGKAVQHTWRDDLSARLQQHIETQLLNHCDEANREMTSTSDIPDTIPISVKATQTTSKDAKAHTLTVFTGIKDKKYLDTLLAKEPFPDMEIVPVAWK